MAKYFGTNGIRGKIDFLTPEFALKISRAFGTIYKGKILVGRDNRITSEMLKEAVISGLLWTGCKVIDLGITPAPTVEFEVRKMNANGGVIITASHNPPEWNALKFVDGNGIAISRERGEEIERVYEEKKFVNVDWKEIKPVMKYEFGIREHIEAIKNFIDVEKIRKRNLFLILDCGNGTASLLAPYLFRELGCKIITLNAHMDGFFPGRSSEPTEENLGELIESVKGLRADAGIAWDGDGDRVIFIDEKGNYIIGDKSFALCVKFMLEKKKSSVITTVATTNMISDIAKEYGARVEYTKVGGPYLSEKICETSGIIGGEEVGGIIWPSIHYGKDGFITAGKIIEKICEKPLSALIAQLPIYYNSKIKIPVSSEEKERIMKRVKEKFKDEKDVIFIDGIRVNYGDEWCIIRASGTENYIRIFAEAKTKERADELVKKFKKYIK